MKPTTISIVSIAGALGVIAAIGFAQPDGIDPPAGPVTDTQPSLTTVSDQISALSTQLTNDIYIGKQFFDLPNGQTEPLSSNSIYLKRITMQGGRATITDANGLSYLCDADEFVNHNGILVRTNNSAFEFGIEMQGPVTITGNDNTLARLIVIYKELP